MRTSGFMEVRKKLGAFVDVHQSVINQLVRIFSIEVRSLSERVSISSRACLILVLKVQQVIWRNERRRPNS